MEPGIIDLLHFVDQKLYLIDIMKHYGEQK